MPNSPALYGSTLPVGYVFSGQFAYHYDPAKSDPKNRWLVWDGEKFIPFASEAAQALLKELHDAQ